MILTDPEVLLGGVDLRPQANSLEVSYEAETRDVTTFGSSGTRIHKGGLYVLAGDIGGFADDAALGASVWDKVGGGGPHVFSATEDGTDGTAGYAFKSVVTSRTTPSGSVGDPDTLTLSLSGQSGDPLVRGTVMHERAAEGSSSSGTVRQLGAVGADQKVYAALHVVSASGTAPTLDVTVESDDASGFLSPTTRLTFAQATGQTAGWVSTPGSIADDWWRVSWTIGGTTPSFVFFVLVAIQ